MTEQEKALLADEIMEFLAGHARTAADFDPAFDDPDERYSGPDAATLHAAALALREGSDVLPAQSSWESGCYAPYGNREAREWHDRIAARLAGIVNAARRAPGR